MADFELSETEFQSWTPIAAAFDTLAESMGVHDAALAIAQRLRSGLVLAAAEHIVRENRPEDRVDFAKVPPTQWYPEWVASPRSPFWRTGQVTLTVRAAASMRDSPAKATYFGLRLDPAGLAKLLPASPAPAKVITPTPAPSVPARHAGGRPSWSGWDDLWAEIGAQLYNGDLKPTKQRDIEDAMNEVAEQMGGPAEASIRTRARKLWAAITREDKN